MAKLDTKQKPKKNKKSQMTALVRNKCSFFQEVIQKTISHVQKNKFLDILVVSDVIRCVKMMKVIYANIDKLLEQMDSMHDDAVMKRMQEINNDLSMAIKSYGTESLEDLLVVCIGTNSVVENNANPVFCLLKKYFHPIGYSVVGNKYIPSSVFCEDIISPSAGFHTKVYGMNVSIYDESNKKVVQVIGVVDDIVLEFVTNDYITEKKKRVISGIPCNEEFHMPAFRVFADSLVLKDYLLCDDKEIYSKYIGYNNEVKSIREKDLNTIVKRFIEEDMYSKRLILVVLLVHNEICENQYLAYLLYDMLTNETDNTIDTQEQTILFDSFPWNIKQLFKDAMKLTAQYTTSLTKIDIQKIPLEQQICLMKTTDVVKEKAMMKLKELKNKTDDNGGKARQYLDGLVKIPFGVFKTEQILKIMRDTKRDFVCVCNDNGFGHFTNIDKITIVDMLSCIRSYISNIHTMTRPQLVEVAKGINAYTKKHKMLCGEKIGYVGKTKNDLSDEVKAFVVKHTGFKFGPYQSISKNLEVIKTYLSDVKTTLDASVYGHENAKKQINKIIGQWINGEQKGYCFGFEGPPGSGKTSLAKYGLAKCLKDCDGNPRPFAMIQMGGDCQGSTLVGHNYTYVGSSWGSIVQILIDKKCMNPIIFIDEIDKVSKTEHGRELIGIMTHMLDPTQNDCFQDKYFSGVDIDLSKALFVLSYNDAALIDRILLDRIHRVRFDALSVDEKIVISNKYMLPDIYKRVGLMDVIDIDTETIKYLIEEHTFEAGVRKLKELFFDIVGEINLQVLTGDIDIIDKLCVTKENVHGFMKGRQKVVHRQISDTSIIGSVNGMYATTLGTGGVLPISCTFYPSNQFLSLKLTGLQQEVMKESMHLGLTLAWNYTGDEKKREIREKYEKDNCSAINIHAGDLDVQKEGPSAGIAICTAIYSLLNELPIKQNIAVTGEISMHGEVMAIGGLGNKILGSLKTGANYFIYPEENEYDFNEFQEKYKDSGRLDDLTFLAVKHISQVFDVIFDNELKDKI